MSDNVHEHVVIIGAGAAGLTAGIYTARANLSPVIIAGLQPGGQMTITSDVENYPGFADVIQGPWLMTQMQAQAENVGARVVYDIVTGMDTSARPFTLTFDSGMIMTADAVILATGAQARWLGLQSEANFNGRGVSACATCDGFFYKGRDVAVIGGGNTAVEEALYLANIASHVTLVHRRDTLRAEKILSDRIIERSKTGNVRIIWNHELTEVQGNEQEVTGVKLKHTQNQQVQSIAAEGVFVAIGHDPNTNIFKGKLNMNESGYLDIQGGQAGNFTQTSIPGIFAAGDVCDHIYRQAITSAGTGCMAALDAEKYLDNLTDK